MAKKGFIPDQLVEDIRARADIAQIVGESVALKRVGSRLVGLCPFHEDSKPSFYVNPDRGAFKCFGCGVGGDVFRFVMETQRLAFPEAVRLLAERVGVEIPEGAEGGAPRGHRDRLYAANEAALAFFREMLAHPEAGRAARDYLAQRQTPKAMVDAFELGFAPDAWDRLSTQLLKRGVAMKDAEAVGLIAPRERGGGHYDRFRNRLMFPVRGTTGKIVAFSGRLLEGDGPKYINSPESDIFAKNRTFYGLHLAGAAIRKTGMALICEGNFDVVSLHEHGFQNAVAALGTAFTERHVDLMERYTKDIVFVFDGDAAGRKAMVRLLDFFAAREYQPRVLVLPPGDDPDSFLKNSGREALEKLLAKAGSLVDFAVDEVFAKYRSDPEGTSRALVEACEIASRLTSPIRRGLLAKTLAARAKLTEEDVRRQIDGARRGSRAPAMARPVKAEGRGHDAGWTILATLLHHRGSKAEVDADAIQMALPEGPMRTLAGRLLAAPAEKDPLVLSDLVDIDDEDALRDLAGELMMSEEPCPARQAVEALQQAMGRCEREKIEEEMRVVASLKAAAEKQNDPGRVDELTRRLFALRKQIEMIRF